MKNKNRCVDCQMFDKMIAMANHVRKTSYCSIGRKIVYVHSVRSVACDKFKQREIFNKNWRTEQ